MLVVVLPLNGIELVDKAHDREAVETSTHDECGDCCTNDSKDNDGAEVLEEVTL